MKDCYELKNPRKNPYAERMKNGYTIIIDRDTVEPEEISETNKNPDITPRLQTLTKS